MNSTPLHIKTGSDGEEIVVSYLKSLGHKIIDRNFRTRFGEIDIISVDKFGITIFTEVKTVRHSMPKKPSVLDAEKSFPHTIPKVGDNSATDLDFMDNFKPEDHYTRGKSDRFRRIVQYYANTHPEIINSKRGYRLDLITLTIFDNDVVARRYENVC